jgi:hypothetical protein
VDEGAPSRWISSPKLWTTAPLSTEHPRDDPSTGDDGGQRWDDETASDVDVRKVVHNPQRYHYYRGF